MDGWNEDKVTALLEHLADISRAQDRQAKALETIAEGTKIGGPLNGIGVALNHVSDAIRGASRFMGGR